MSAVLEAPGVIGVAGKQYISVEEVMEYFDCEQTKAYRIIKELRKELVEADRITPAYPQGKVPRRYFIERCMIEE